MIVRVIGLETERHPTCLVDRVICIYDAIVIRGMASAPSKRLCFAVAVSIIFGIAAVWPHYASMRGVKKGDTKLSQLHVEEPANTMRHRERPPSNMHIFEEWTPMVDALDVQASKRVKPPSTGAQRSEVARRNGCKGCCDLEERHRAHAGGTKFWSCSADIVRPGLKFNMSRSVPKSFSGDLHLDPNSTLNKQLRTDLAAAGWKQVEVDKAQVQFIHQIGHSSLRDAYLTDKQVAVPAFTANPYIRRRSGTGGLAAHIGWQSSPAASIASTKA